MARLELFPAAASKGASHVTMNLALPCLIFSSIVPGMQTNDVIFSSVCSKLSSLYPIEYIRCRTLIPPRFCLPGAWLLLWYVRNARLRLVFTLTARFAGPGGLLCSSKFLSRFGSHVCYIQLGKLTYVYAVLLRLSLVRIILGTATAVVLSVTQVAPFNPATDPDRKCQTY